MRWYMTTPGRGDAPWEPAVRGRSGSLAPQSCWHRAIRATRRAPNRRDRGRGRQQPAATAAGSPEVAARIGGIPDFVTGGVRELMVEPGSVAELGGALDRMATDRALAPRLTPGRRNSVTAFTASTVVRRIEALYAVALGGSAVGAIS